LIIINTEELFDNYEDEQYMDYKIIKSYNVYKAIILEQNGFDIQPIYFMTRKDLNDYFQKNGLIELKINHVHTYLEMCQKYYNENDEEIYLT